MCVKWTTTGTIIEVVLSTSGELVEPHTLSFVLVDSLPEVMKAYPAAIGRFLACRSEFLSLLFLGGRFAVWTELWRRVGWGLPHSSQVSRDRQLLDRWTDFRQPKQRPLVFTNSLLSSTLFFLNSWHLVRGCVPLHSGHCSWMVLMAKLSALFRPLPL